ncbi:hypothetical protein bthur0001_41380 [Bacillus thuringiensis serovar tochigiensis BGSC 4Y1]|nr:hypothetical protein bthur0001_41380 [Bacillus thuringiensis serovar tochigiensis BGSC 4Y1]
MIVFVMNVVEICMIVNVKINKQNRYFNWLSPLKGASRG